MGKLLLCILIQTKCIYVLFTNDVSGVYLTVVALRNIRESKQCHQQKTITMITCLIN